MSVYQSLSLVENLAVYLGQISVRYNPVKGKYEKIKYPFWTVLKISVFYIILYLVTFTIDPNSLSKIQQFNVVQMLAIYFVRSYRFVHDIIQLIEMRCTQTVFMKTMNKFLFVCNKIRRAVKNNDKIKVKYYVYAALIVLFLIEGLAITLLLWALHCKIDLYTGLSTAFYNGHNAIEIFMLEYLCFSQCFIKVIKMCVKFNVSFFL